MRPADTTAVLRDYLAGWNAPDADTRHGLLANAVHRDIVYLDPDIPEPVKGLPALESHIAFFRTNHEHKLEAALPADKQHTVLRTRWRLKLPEGEEMSRGILVADLGDDGRLKRVIHFVDGQSG